MMRMIGTTALAALLLLSGCGKRDESNGGVTAEEARQLDNAAEMLDTSPDGLTAGNDVELGNGEESAPADANAAAPAGGY